MTPIELHAALMHALALLEQQRVADPHGFAFGPKRPANGFAMPTQGPPIRAFNPNGQYGWGAAGWGFGVGGAGRYPFASVPSVQGLRNWVPPYAPPVST